MSIFNRKNYDDDIEELKGNFAKLAEEHDNLKKSNKKLQKENKTLIERYNLLSDNMKAMMTADDNLNKKQLDLLGKIQRVTSKVNEIDSELHPPKKEVARVPNGSNIKDFSWYNHYNKERIYNMKEGTWKINSGNPRSANCFTLSFDQLVTIIQMYKAGRKVSEIAKNPILSDKTIPQVQTYVYMWRAGSFNKEIKRTARKLGYNPKKLISTEV